LLPYTAGVHTDLGLELALRILFNQPDASLTVLQVLAPGDPSGEFSHEFRAMMPQIPVEVRNRIRFEPIQTKEPMQAVIAASEQFDLTIAGASREWGIERQTLGQYTDTLAVECRSSLLIVRRYSQMTTHLATVLDPEVDSEPSPVAKPATLPQPDQSGASV
jgi:hypothetical protein